MARKRTASRDYQPDKSHRRPVLTVKTGNKLMKKKMNKAIGAVSYQLMLILCCLVTMSCPTLCDPMTLHGSQCLPPGDHPNSGINSHFLHWQVGSLSLAPPGKHRPPNT